MKILSKVVFYFGVITSYLYPKRIATLFRQVVNKFYSGYYYRLFSKCGVNIQIAYPSNLLGLEYVSIGKNFQSFARLRLEAIDRYNEYFYKPSIIIGDNVSMNFDCHIGCINKIYIGNNVLIGSRVLITDHYHGEVSNMVLCIPPSERELFSKSEVIIMDNVLIGEGVSIMPGVTLGSNCIVGANSVVTKSFPVNSIIAGVPAKLIRTV